MMGSMQALSIVIKKASAKSIVGSAVLNLLQSQVYNQWLTYFPEIWEFPVDYYCMYDCLVLLYFYQSMDTAVAV